jgi:RimJ/RimL family protein N-acetyltransferase
MVDPVLETDRLFLRRFVLDDAGFIVELLNQPSFKQYIGDRGVDTRDDAVAYLENGPRKSYETWGYGAYLVAPKDGGVPIGMCGFFRRDNLDHPDLGFAFLERYFGQGFAVEAARAVVAHARDVLGLPLLAAVTDPANSRSIALLEKVGFRYAGPYSMPDDDTVLNYYAISLEPD